MPASRPRYSVVVPAHDEATVIDRLLAPWSDRLAAGDVELVVVANGCTDDTAERARRHHGVRVVELAQGSKIAALNAGDASAEVFPRFYVDADVEVGPAALDRVADVLDEGRVLAAAPRPDFDLRGSSAVVRAFYRHLLTTPYLGPHLVGLGVYGLSAAGRARFSSFPDVTADDLFIAGLFREQERASVPGSTFTVHVPRTVRALLTVRERVYRGNLQAAARGTSGTLTPQGAATSLRRALGAASRTDAAVYYGLNALAKQRARRRPDASWGRDATSRASLATARSGPGD